MWLVRDTHFNAFAKARIRHLMAQGLTLQQAMNRGMLDMPAFPLVEIAHWTKDPDSVRAAVFPSQRGAMTHRVRLEHFAAGAALGYVGFGLDGFGHENWHWTVRCPRCRPRPSLQRTKRMRWCAAGGSPSCLARHLTQAGHGIPSSRFAIPWPVAYAMLMGANSA